MSQSKKSFIKRDKVEKFMKLAGQVVRDSLDAGSKEERLLGAQLLLSETLEYVIKGLGIAPVVQGVKITDPDALKFEEFREPNPTEMVDGLADVAYTMIWNANAFGIPLEEAYDIISDNNLEKFVKVSSDSFKEGLVAKEQWHLNQNIKWPKEVVQVEIISLNGELFAVGKDKNGKVRKPSSFSPPKLKSLLNNG
ncbi:MAG: hypothetical protein D6780_07865 [Candidatus Dadabacteria bacterium]|nr:MAG: hypothetical protein D6780_07865 [Candidatus Dadabacteria bacterium]